MVEVMAKESLVILGGEKFWKFEIKERKETFLFKIENKNREREREKSFYL